MASRGSGCGLVGCIAALCISACSSERDFGNGPAGGAPGVGGLAGTPGSGGTGNQAGTGNDGGAGNTGAPVELTESSVPNGWYNVDYSAPLAITGGAEPFVFTVQRGALPRGITVSETGELRGRPTVEGEFAFTLAVTDAAGSSDSADYTLHIDRKRWLAVTSQHAADGVHLTAVDTSSHLLATIDLTPDATPSTNVREVSFAPDGGWLAFLADIEVDEVYDLYLVDTRSKNIGTPIRIAADGSVDGYGWSPDSTKIAYTSQGDRALRYSDVSSGTPEPFGPYSAGGASGPVYWVNDTTIVCRMDVPGGSSYGAVARIGQTTPPALETLGVAIQGTFQRTDPPSEKFGTIDHYFVNAATYFDLGNKRIVETTTQYTFFSPDLEYAVVSGSTAGSTNTVAFLHAHEFTTGEPVAILTGSRPKGWVGPRAVWETGTAPYLVVGLGSGADTTSLVLTGPYTEPSHPQWAKAHDGYVFTATEGVFWSRIDASTQPATATPALRISKELPQGAYIQAFEVAPDGSSVIYVSDHDQPGTNDIHAVALGPVPGAPERLTPDGVLSGGSVYYPNVPAGPRPPFRAWSRDSSQAAFAVDRFGTGHYSVYLRNMIDPNAIAVMLPSVPGSSPPTFWFQP